MPVADALRCTGPRLVCPHTHERKKELNFVVFLCRGTSDYRSHRGAPCCFGESMYSLRVRLQLDCLWGLGSPMFMFSHLPGGTRGAGSFARGNVHGERRHAVDLPQSSPNVGIHSRYRHQFRHQLSAVGKKKTIPSYYFQVSGKFGAVQHIHFTRGVPTSFCKIQTATFTVDVAAVFLLAR